MVRKIKDNKDKPIWPYPELGKMSAHASGQWAKQIKGKMIYFGRWEDPDGARRRLLEFMKTVQEKSTATVQALPGEITVSNVVNNFLEAKHKKVESGDLTPRQFVEYREIGITLTSVFGRSMRWADITPNDWARYKESLKGSPGRIASLVIWTRSFAKYAFDMWGIVPRYGGMFSRPKKKEMRKFQRERERNFFTALELDAILKACTPALRAMAYLGLNAGFGQTDCSTLPADVVDLKSGILRYERHKTGVDRIIVLWPETIKALQEYKRPSNKHPELFFETRWGLPFVTNRIVRDANDRVKETKRKDSVQLEWGKAQKKAYAVLAKSGAINPDSEPYDCRGFYLLRHMFSTYADEVGDTAAKKAIMGHAFDGLDEFYNHARRYGFDRIRKVTEYVRSKVILSPIRTDAPPATA